MVPQNTFDLLTVCTGNIARSPLTEQLFAARLQPAAEFHVSSAGTEAVVGHAMTPEAAALSSRLGGMTRTHAGRAITPEIIGSAQLVLTATRDHRSAVVAMLPRASRYTFTVRQFARLVGSLDASILAPVPNENPRERAERLVIEAAAQRGYLAPLATPDDDDIEDPFRQSSDVYDRVARQIDDAVKLIVAAFVITSVGSLGRADNGS
ncbi:MAG: low molecular weight phosphatase family protein [Rhodoglobus sp.]